MAELQTLEVPVKGMDCAECTLHVQQAIARLPGVESVNVLLTTEKAVIQLDPARVDLSAIRKAVESAGYSVPDSATPLATSMDSFNRRMTVLLAIVFSVVLSIVIAGEWLGLFDELNELVPLPIGTALVIVGGFPIFRNVVRATLKRQITSHTLMTVGAIAALIVGEWVAAAIVVVFMRVGDYVERFTTESARRAVKELTAMAPQTARGTRRYRSGSAGS